MSAATVSLPDMGEWNITSQIKIDGQIAPDFSFDWEVLFQGHKYIQPLRKPQGSKENTTLNSVIDLTFQHWAIYQLKRWYFFTAQPVETGTAIPDKYIATVSLNLGDFCALFGTILNYYYGDKITISLDPQWQYKSEAEVVEISYSHIWDVLIKLYEVYGVRWVIEPNGSPEKYVIKVGYPTTEQSHIFEYGFEGGLLKVERQVQSDEIANMLLGRGGEKNLPYRYFKNVDPENPSFKADPDWIEELSNIYFANLMPATFRSYVQGWKAAHISKYPGYKAVGEANAYAPWAYRKGFTDEKFDPVEYVADEITINPETGDKIVVISPTYSPYVKKDSSIAKYGPLLNGLENNDEIYPTIQGVTIDPFGRINEAIEVEPITSDDIEGAGESEAQITTLLGIVSPTLKVGANARQVFILQGEFSVEKGRTADLITDLTKSGRASDLSLLESEVIIESQSITLKNKVTGQTHSASGIPSGNYSYQITVNVHNASSKDLYITIACPTPKLVDSALSDQWTNKWRIWVKNLWQTSKQSGETDAQYAERVWRPILGDREGNEAKMVFASGLLAHEDYEFTITSIPKYERKLCKWQTVENGKVVEHEYWSEWCIELGKSDAELDTLGVYLPSVMRQAIAGDFFFFIGIDMPHLYTVWAEERIDNWKKDNLEDKKDIKPTWVVTTDRVRLNNEGREDALICKLHPGDTLRLADKRFIEGDYETLYLSSLTYKYREPSSDDTALNPDVEIVLSDRYEVSANPVTTLQGEVSALAKQIGSMSNVEQVVRAVADKLYLRKDGLPDRSMSPTEFASLLTSLGFRSGMVGGAGWGIYKDANDNWVIEADRIMARQDFEVNNLVINQVVGQGGTIVESAARMEITHVEDTASGYQCYFDQHEGTVANLFRVDDVAWCNRFTPENNSLKFYKRRVIEVGVDYVLLSKTYVNGSGIPTEGDAIVQYGNYTDKNRQYIKVRDVIGGGYERYIEGLDSVNATGVEYYFVGRQTGLYNGRPRWFIGDENGFIEWINGALNIKGSLNMLSTYDGKALGDYIGDAAQSAADKAKAELQSRIDELQNQIDGVVETWNGTVDPTKANYPASGWTTETDKQAHIGDAYFNIGAYNASTNPNAGHAWRWYYNSATDYGWIELADSDAVRALQLAQMSVTGTDVLYKKGSSLTDVPTPLPTIGATGDITGYNGWSTDAPDWESGKYIWQTTYVKKGDGSATFSAPTCISGKNGRGIDRIEEEYCLSDSSSTPTPNVWYDEAHKPTWVAGKYMWTRSHVYYTDGTDETFGEVCVTGATGTSVLAEYSSDGTSWHPAYQSGDVWMHTGTDGVNWSPAVRIQGIGYSTNLIRHTKDMTGWGTDYSTNVGFSYETDTDGFTVVTQNIKTGGGNNNAYWWLWNTNNVNNQRLVESPNDVFVPGRRYTLSFEFISYPADHPVGGYIDVRPGDDGSGRITLMSFLFSNPSGIWERVTRTFVCPQFNKNKTLSLFGLAFNANAPKDAYLKIRKICLVEGDSSEWTPAPSEMVGQDGQYRKWQWAVHTSSTSADGIAESSWKDTPLTANPGQYVWMRSGIVVPPATEPTSYDKPYTRVTGDKGDSSYMLDLTDEVKGIACDSSGNPLSASIPTSQASVFKGSEKVTSGVSYSIAQKTGITNANVTSAGVVTLSGLTADTATVVVQAVVNGVTLQSNISVYKVKPGGSYAPNLLKGTKNGILSPGASPATGAYGNCAVVFFDEGTVLSVGDKIAVKIESIEQLAGSAPNGYSLWPYSVLSNGALKSALCPNPKTVKTSDLQCTFEITSTTPEGQYPALLVYPAVNGALTGCQAQYGRIMVVRGDTPMDWSPAASEMEGAVVYQIEPSVDNITKSMTGELSETSLKCKVYKTTGDSPRELTSDKQVRFQVIKKDGSSTISTLWPTNGETASVAVTEDTESIICELIDGSTVLDRERVPVISDASDLEIGGRNLLLRSGQGITTANYLVDKYYLSVNPIVGKTYTFTLWGQLASSKTDFGLWNSGGDVNLALLKKVADGKYQATFDWVNTAGGKTATGKHIELYALLNTQSGTSIVNRVKLEEGNVGTDWSPAPEDTGAGVNLLRNSRARLTKTYTSTGDWYNLLKKETVYLEQGKTYTISARTNCAKFTNVHGTPYENKCVLWLCSTADSTQGVVNQIVSGTDMSTDGSRGQTFVWNHPSGEYFLRVNFYAAGTWWAEKVKIEKGSYATEWTPSPEDVEYMEDALKENTKIEGGLMLISTISLGQNNTDYTSQTTWSGINGIYKETAIGGGIAAWYGGDMEDLANYYNWSNTEGKWVAKSGVTPPSRIAKGIDRFDGSGYKASGNLWWDEVGNLYANGMFTGQMTVGNPTGQRIDLDPMQQVMNIFSDNGTLVATHSGRTLTVDEARPADTQGVSGKTVVSITSKTLTINSGSSVSETLDRSICSGKATGSGTLTIDVPSFILTASTQASSSSMQIQPMASIELYLVVTVGTKIMKYSLGQATSLSVSSSVTTPANKYQIPIPKNTSYSAKITAEYSVSGSQGARGTLGGSSPTVPYDLTTQAYRCEYGANGWIISTDSKNYAYLIVENGKLNFKVVSNGNTVISS